LAFEKTFQQTLSTSCPTSNRTPLIMCISQN